MSWIALSEEGKKRRRAIEEFMNGLTDEVMEDVPEEKREIFTEVLSIMYEKLGEKLK